MLMRFLIEKLELRCGGRFRNNRLIISCEFRLGKRAAKVVENMAVVLGGGYVNAARRWFVKFKAVDFSLEN